MPAGLYQTVLASSAEAAPPAKAFPVPLPLWVPMPNPPAPAPDANPPSAAQTPIVANFFLNDFMIPPLVEIGLVVIASPKLLKNILLSGRIPTTKSSRDYPLLLRRNNTRFAVLVHRDVGQRRLCDLHDFLALRLVLRVDLDVDGDRGPPHPHDFRVEADEVADEHGLLEHERIHRDGRDAPLGEPHRRDAA